MNNIYRTAKECADFMSANITKRKNRIHSGNLIFTDYDILGNLQHWEKLLQNLCSVISQKYPLIEQNLGDYIQKFDGEPIVYFTSIATIIECVLSLEKESNGKRVFISHSSKDKQLVKDFVNHILCLGIGVNPDDIFCSSIEDMTIRNGEDIRKHIQDNIRSAEYSFLLISDNYKASEICVNEMGAVWAYDANVKLFLLPNADFPSIGWLCDTRKADKITDSVALDRLYNEMIEYFSLPGNFLHWSAQRETFVGRIRES